MIMNLMMKIFKLEVYMKGTYFYLYLNIFSLLFDLAYEDKYLILYRYVAKN